MAVIGRAKMTLESGSAKHKDNHETMKTAKTLMLSASFAALACSTMAQSWLRNGLVAYYPFNGSANDVTGNGYHGIIDGNVIAANDRFGNAGSAYHFDGLAGSIRVTNTVLNIGQTAFTISGWFCSDDVTKIDQIVFNALPDHGLSVTLNGNLCKTYLGYSIGPASADWNVLAAHGSKNNYTNNVWYHVVITKSTTTYVLYVNGQVSDIKTVPQSASYNYNVSYIFGSVNSNGSEVFKGTLDDFRVYNRTLSSKEVAQLYTAESSPFFSPQGGNTGTDPAHKLAWGENVGWANSAPTNYEVSTHFYEGTGGWLSGHVWSENAGWIVMGSAGGGPYANTTSNNWGVNVADNGELSGYAWAENVGWINFSHAQCDAAINLTSGEFSGFAWGENVGWLKFKGASPDYGVRTLTFDTQLQGTPNWWLDYHYVSEGYDAGDGVPAWRKYVMDVDPSKTDNALRITAVSNALGASVVVFAPVSTRRYYTLTRRVDLIAGGWSNVVGQVSVPGTGGGQTMQDTNVSTRAIYSVKVTVSP